MNEKQCRDIVKERSGGRCEVCGRAGVQMHHRRNRSQGGQWTPANIIHVCVEDHKDIGEHPWRSSLDGYTIQGTQAVPADVAVWRFNPQRGVSTLVHLLDDGSIRDQEAA